MRAVLVVFSLLASSCGGGAPPPPADSGTDAPPECTTSAQCDDGLYCNGLETCSGSGTCVAGSLVLCDDGVACTLDVCSETRQACVHRPTDADGDGHGAASCVDTAGAAIGDDCDDTDPDRYPGNLEICDAADHDEDCDVTSFGMLDADGDGYPSDQCCNRDATSNHCGTDCDDGRPGVHPMSTEVCNGLDDECDGAIDDGVLIAQFPDGDFDRYGRIGSTAVMVCPGTPGYSQFDTDCDDASPLRHPAQLELCDTDDNDCDGRVDENPSLVDWYLDADADGFGTATVAPISSCAPIVGRSVLDTDCDDGSASRHPGAAELCDGVDQDCNGLLDSDVLAAGDYEDDDGDGVVDIACGLPLGRDCNDGDPNVGVGGAETCNGRDDDCDAIVDEDTDDRLFYVDRDGDGFGSAISGTTLACAAPAGFVSRGNDCDDADIGVAPGATEACNGEDDDCDGTIDEAAFAACPTINGTGTCVGGRCAVASCNPGSGDCNRDPRDGCETPTTTVTNCGACGAVCASEPGLVMSCGGSPARCSVTTCPTNKADCDNFGGNGCETFTDVDPAHCGGCSPCSLSNASPLCSNGTCVVGFCEDGFADCDRNPANGCEVDLDTDGANCGACATACTGANSGVASSCIAGDCTLGACLPGFDDCDGDPANGCETDLATSTNCGVCGRSCALPSGLPAACVAGSCVIASCPVDRLDCNGDPSDGCEVYALTDARHCNGCGNSCEVGNGVGACVAGACTTSSCNPGYDDCTSVGDGLCETRVASDVDNCGGCGNACSVSNGTPSCTDGTCTVAACDGSLGDCNQAFADGCEVDLAGDANNCGACGNACGVGETCAGGSCSTVVDAAIGSSTTCTLHDDGSLVCFGSNARGQMGLGTTTAVPGQVVYPLGGIVEAGAGTDFLCTLDIAGTVRCSGESSSGECGLVSATPFATPRVVAVDMVDLAVGKRGACALDQLGALYCWGQTGAATGAYGVVTGFAASIVRVVVGDQFTCVQTSAPSIECFGDNANGQLGSGVIGVPSTSPTFVTGSNAWADVIELVAGAGHVCALRSGSGTAVCWGRGDEGQLGGALGPHIAAAPLAGAIRVRALSSAANATCVRTDLAVYCIGENPGGRLGTGSSANPLTSFTAVQAIPWGAYVLGSSAAAASTCFADRDRQLAYCVGDNSNSQVDPGSGGTPAIITTAVSF